MQTLPHPVPHTARLKADTIVLSATIGGAVWTWSYFINQAQLFNQVSRVGELSLYTFWLFAATGLFLPCSVLWAHFRMARPLRTVTSLDFRRDMAMTGTEPAIWLRSHLLREFIQAYLPLLAWVTIVFAGLLLLALEPERWPEVAVHRLETWGMLLLFLLIPIQQIVISGTLLSDLIIRGSTLQHSVGFYLLQVLYAFGALVIIGFSGTLITAVIPSWSRPELLNLSQAFAKIGEIAVWLLLWRYRWKSASNTVFNFE